MTVHGRVDHSKPKQSQVQPCAAGYSQVQPGAARYSAEKTHHVLYFRKAGASRISTYSCTDPNCRDSPLELDNSRLSLDENCLIRGEN